MESNQLLDIIALPLLPEVGNQRAKEAIRTFGSAHDALFASAQDWMDVAGASKQQATDIVASREQAVTRAEKELTFIEKNRLSTLYYEDDNYPYRLAECPDCPLLLYGMGNMHYNEGKVVSVVGTRMPSDYGKELCYRLVRDLAAKVPKLTIVSGLAFGIDVTAHKAALDAGISTIIVPGHGLDRIYPHQHRDIARQALVNGGILTEYMSHTEPLPQNFVARNRIVAGLADAVVVVESKIKGGSLITANMAIDYGRDLFAFPGRPGTVQSAGCNALIKHDEAALIENADDLIAAMRWSRKPQQAVQTTLDNLFEQLQPEEQMIMDMLRKNPDGVHTNVLVMESKMPYMPLTALLRQMSARGLVKQLPGGMYRALN